MHDLRDTVSSIGIARSKDMLPRTIDGMSHVCYFRHALALDERRVKFLPEYARGGKSNPPVEAEDQVASPVTPRSPHKENNRESTGNSDFTIPSNEPSDSVPHIDDEAVNDRLEARMKPTRKRPHTKEVWFAGTHSDM